MENGEHRFCGVIATEKGHAWARGVTPEQAAKFALQNAATLMHIPAGAIVDVAVFDMLDIPEFSIDLGTVKNKATGTNLLPCSTIPVSL